MALYNELQIYKPAHDLLALSLEIELQLPRSFKRTFGERVHKYCMDVLEDLANANAHRGEQRVEHIDRMLSRVRAVTALMRVGHEMRTPKPLITHDLYAKSIHILENLGAQAGGWRKSALGTTKTPAA